MQFANEGYDAKLGGGLLSYSRHAMVRERRRQAMEDFPVLRQIASLLITATGKRMARWERLAFCAELLMLDHAVKRAARAAGITHETGYRLRDRLVDAGLVVRYPLTERQKQCRALLEQGFGSKRIAKAMKISRRAAVKHMFYTRKKLAKVAQ